MENFTSSNIAADSYKKELEQEGQRKTLIDHQQLQKDIDDITFKISKANLEKDLDKLLVLEKKCRIEEDAIATKKVCIAIIEAIRKQDDWKLLNQYILMLSKRRSQLKQAIQGYVQLAMTYIKQTPNKDTKVELLKTLLDVTEGKLFVELERSRLTYQLVMIREQEGDIEEAANLIQELAVETFGAMHKQEKVAFILEQVRLTLAKGDFIRSLLLSRKISPRTFQEDKKIKEESMELDTQKQSDDNPLQGQSLANLKLKYYNLMIQYYQYYANYLEIARCYRAIYDTDEMKADPKQSKEVLQKICWYLIISPAYSTEEHSASDYETLLLGISTLDQLNEMPLYRELIKWFIVQEIVLWKSIDEHFIKNKEVNESTVYKEVFNYKYERPIDGKSKKQKSEKKVSEEEIPGNNDRKEQFKLRVVQHNIMVIARYYQRITLDRLSQILHLTKDEAESNLCDLVVAKAIKAKIDRATGIIRIGQPAATEQVLNTWSKNIGKLVSQIEKSSQAIQKEFIVHGIPTS